MTVHDSTSLLLVDDDVIFCEVLEQAMRRCHFTPKVAHDVPEAMALLVGWSPAYAVIDLRMPGPSGLELVAALHQRDPETRIIVLTGYASISTAVEAIKLGAVHYLTKPTDADEIVAAFVREEGDVHVPIAAEPPSVDRLEWEHIQRIMTESGGNISEAARKLGMHRRTLQRKLSKYPVRR
jgi:two-component system, response regulator RegA